MSSQALPGFRDFYPADFAFRAHLFDTWRQVALRYGFEEYDGPPLEPLELYTAKSGDEIVGQLYSFIDKGERQVSLRPEMTPTLARLVAARANGLKKPIRWFSLPQLFRYERQQRGRLREHFQLNCDLIGEAGPLADAEIIALAIDVMRAFGLGPADVRVRLSDRRVLTTLARSRGIAEADLQLTFAAVDKVERLKQTDLEWMLKDRPSTAAAIALVQEITQLKGMSTVTAALGGGAEGTAALAPLRATLNALEAMGLAEFIDVDLTIVRGLAYYTGTVFELFDAGKTLRAICGGGRYDDLSLAVGGVQLPAVGFGMGDVVLGELLKARGLVPSIPAAIQVFVAGVTAEDQPYVLRVAHQLRDAGVRVEYALTEQALGKQLKLADARQAALAIVIGPDDRIRGEVQLKDLQGKSQVAVPLVRVVEEVRVALKAHPLTPDP